MKKRSAVKKCSAGKRLGRLQYKEKDSTLCTRKERVTCSVVNRKPKVVFSQPKTDFLKSVFRLALHPEGKGHVQGCEPKTESRFFGRFFATEKKSVFRLPKKRNRKIESVSFGRFFHVPYVKNAYISVWKPRYGWTRGHLRHTAAAAAAA